MASNSFSETIYMVSENKHPNLLCTKIMMICQENKIALDEEVNQC